MADSDRATELAGGRTNRARSPFITHDLGVVATIADRVVVLDGGRISEQGTVDVVLHAPSNEYTQALLRAAPTLPTPTTEPAAPSTA
jgi:ABC-type dipeptide/oligopeptide/nickel transport system ATPase component